MRNWPYAYGLGNGADSAVKDLFGVTTLPVGAEGDTSAATLGGWNVAVSKYSTKQEAAVSLAMYLAGPEAQKQRAIAESNLPTIVALYDDADIAAAQPIIPQWKDVFLNAVPRRRHRRLASTTRCPRSSGRRFTPPCRAMARLPKTWNCWKLI
jgi:trehalose/maltose transport system substrate-binding protein